MARSIYERSKQWNRDRGRFANPPEWPERHGVSGVLRWQLGERTKAEPDFRPPFIENDGAALRENGTRPSVTWIGHASLLVQLDGVNVLTDPVFSDGFFM